MINKENKDNLEKQDQQGYLDVAKMDVQAHLLIKDVDTGEILVNKRG